MVKLGNGENEQLFWTKICESLDHRF